MPPVDFPVDIVDWSLPVWRRVTHLWFSNWRAMFVFVILAKDDNFPEIWKLLLPCSNVKAYDMIWRKEKYCQVANNPAEFVRLLSVSWNSRGDATTSWSHDRRFGLWDIELSVCRVSNRKCGRFVSLIPLKSLQRIKTWKGTLRLRAYNESLLQQIGNSDHQW